MTYNLNDCQIRNTFQTFYIVLSLKLTCSWLAWLWQRLLTPLPTKLTVTVGAAVQTKQRLPRPATIREEEKRREWGQIKAKGTERRWLELSPGWRRPVRQGGSCFLEANAKAASSSAACHSWIGHMEAHSSKSSGKWLDVIQCSKWDASLLMLVTRWLSASRPEAAPGSKFICCQWLEASVSDEQQLSQSTMRPHGRTIESSPPSVTVECVQTCSTACRIIGFNTASAQNADEFQRSSLSFPSQHLSTQVTTALKFEPAGGFDGYNNISQYNFTCLQFMLRWRILFGEVRIFFFPIVNFVLAVCWPLLTSENIMTSRAWII